MKIADANTAPAARVPNEINTVVHAESELEPVVVDGVEITTVVVARAGVVKTGAIIEGVTIGGDTVVKEPTTHWLSNVPSRERTRQKYVVFWSMGEVGV